MITVEICVNGIHSAVAAQNGGAHRIELCDNLHEGGTTPSFGTVAVVSEKLSIGLMVMIRPRGGDFCYTDDEFAVMTANIKQFHSLPIRGIVFGALHPSGEIDSKRCQTLIELARPMRVTFHRAFDMTRDPFEALDTCLALGVDTILTSGHQPKASMGLNLIAKLQHRAAGQLQIMPGSGVTIENVQEVVEKTAVSAIHVSSAVQHILPSPMQYQNHSLTMGAAAQPEYQTIVTSSSKVQQLVQHLNPFV